MKKITFVLILMGLSIGFAKTDKNESRKPSQVAVEPIPFYRMDIGSKVSVSDVFNFVQEHGKEISAADGGPSNFYAQISCHIFPGKKDEKYCIITSQKAQ